MSEREREKTFRPVIDNKFQFKCHKDIPCFTKCCAALNLLLTPYDILRLKNRMNIPSDFFLDKYTDSKVDNRSRFPMVYLRMSDGEREDCPFLDKNDGCIVYEDRPGSCRIYPVGRATAKPEGKGTVTERFFLVREDHCMGFNEGKQWTVQEWMNNEGLEQYNFMNDQWMEIITSMKDLGSGDSFKKKSRCFLWPHITLINLENFYSKAPFLITLKSARA